MGNTDKKSSGSESIRNRRIFDKKIRGLIDLGYQVENYIIDNYVASGQKVRFRTEIGFHMLTFMVHYVDSFTLLMQRKNIYASESMLRTIFEGWANMHYIYATRSYENLVRYLYDGDSAFIKNAESTKSIMCDPSNETDSFTEIYDEVIEIRRSAIKDWEKYGYPLKNMPRLPDRLKALEVRYDSVDFLLYYHHEYSEFSTSVHVTKDNLIAMSYAENYDNYFNGFESDYVKSIRMVDMATDLLSKSAKLIVKKCGKEPTAEQTEIINRKVTWRVA